MFNKTMSKKVMCLVLVGSMLNSTLVFAKEATGKGSINKDETVYVTLSSDGTVKNEIVNNLIHSNTILPEIKDKSSLENIKNLKGNELPQKSDDILLWKTNKSDILYQGNTKKDLPIGVKITYFLEDEEISPKDLGGKSGKVKIKIDIENKNKRTVNVNGKSKTLYTPLSVATVLILPEANFSNIKTNAGLIESIGNNKIVTFASVPGMMKSLGVIGGKLADKLPDTLEITADASDFQMAPIYMAASQELPNIDTIKAAKNLEELGKGVDALKDGTNTILDGVNKLDDGLGTMLSGITTLNYKINTEDLQENGDPKGLKLAISRLNAGVEGLDKNSKLLADGTTKLYKAVQGLDYKINSTKINDGKPEGIMGGTNMLVGGIKKLDGAVGQEGVGIQGIYNGLTSEKIDSKTGLPMGLRGGLLGAQAGTNELIKNTKTLMAAAAKDPTLALALAKNHLVDPTDPTGAKALAQLNKLQAAMQMLVDKTAKTKDFDPANPQTYTKSLANAVLGLQAGNKQIKAGTEGAVKSATVFKGAINQLGKGVHDDLVPNVGKLNEGVNLLSKGVSTTMAPKTNKIHKNVDLLGTTINDTVLPGVEKLKDGSGKLSEGVDKFNKEGISKLSGKVSPLLTDVKDVLATKDELVKLSEEAQTFTGKEDGMEGTVKFIIKTEEIKATEVKETKKESGKNSVKEEKKSLWEKFKSLF